MIMAIFMIMCLSMAIVAMAMDPPDSGIPFADLRHVSLVRHGLELKCLSSSDKVWWEWAYVHDKCKLNKDIHRYLKQLDIPAIMQKYLLPPNVVHRSTGIDKSRRKQIKGDTHVCTSSGLIALLCHVFTTKQVSAFSKTQAWDIVSKLVVLVMPVIAGCKVRLSCTTSPITEWTAEATVDKWGRLVFDTNGIPMFILEAWHECFTTGLYGHVLGTPFMGQCPRLLDMILFFLWTPANDRYEQLWHWIGKCAVNALILVLARGLTTTALDYIKQLDASPGPQHSCLVIQVRIHCIQLFMFEHSWVAFGNKHKIMLN